ncbi:unnamed protein product, partial [marine sediment metagenome]
AAGMSTFASVLIILSSSMIQDIVKKGLKKNLNKNKILFYSKIASIIIGIVSLIIAFNPPALVLTLTAFAWAVIASTTLWPILFGIYWKRATKMGCIISMVGGFITALVWMVIGNPFGIHGFIPGIIVGFILMVLVSLFTPGFSKEHIEKIWG